MVLVVVVALFVAGVCVCLREGERGGGGASRAGFFPAERSVGVGVGGVARPEREQQEPAALSLSLSPHRHPLPPTASLVHRARRRHPQARGQPPLDRATRKTPESIAPHLPLSLSLFRHPPEHTPPLRLNIATAVMVVEAEEGATLNADARRRR